MNKEGNNNNSNSYNKGKVFNNNDGKNYDNNVKKPLRYGEDALSKNLLNKKLKIKLIDNEVIEGILTNLGMYDLTIRRKIQEQFGTVFREKENEIIILKATIITVEVL